jgi:presequence protease
VTLADIPAELPMPHGESALARRPYNPLHFYARGTNGLVYQQLIVELPGLAPELLELLP